MQQLTTNRDAVLRVMKRTQDALDQQVAAGAPSDEMTVAEAAELARELRQAREWAHAVEPFQMAETGEAEELQPDGDYISHHPVIALTQSAMERFADEAEEAGAPAEALKDLADAGDEVPPHLVIDALLFFLRTRPPFPTHQSLDDLRFELAPNATVVLVGDFGTAKPRAIRVAQAIRAVNPDHVIHLGDIYPSGTPELARRHFVDVWQAHGPKNARYWALNGNHEMAAKGIGYFNVVLPFCGQRASYFSLQNEHWKLIGLDSAYIDFDLHPAQKPWLHARLQEGSSRNILLTHHQMFSAVDGRPRENAKRLPRTMQEFVQTGRIFGWYWGHEHRFLSYAADPEFGGYLARAVGHGGKRIKYVSGVTDFPAPAVRHYWEVRRPDKPERCLNGFAILRFNGPQVDITYADEEGTEWNAERWPGQPH